MSSRIHTPDGYFLAKITADLTGGKYSFDEWWSVGGSYVKKQGGRYGNANAPGVALAGVTFTVGDFALARVGAGEAGLKWELIQATSAGITGTGTDNHVTRWNGTSAIQDSLAVLDDSGGITTPGPIEVLNTASVTLNATPSGGAYINFLAGADSCELLRNSGVLGLNCYVPANGAFLLRGNGGAAGVHYSIDDGTATYDGQTGTLGDGSTVKGGIITTIGAGGNTIDGGTF